MEKLNGILIDGVFYERVAADKPDVKCKEVCDLYKRCNAPEDGKHWYCERVFGNLFYHFKNRGDVMVQKKG